MLSPRERQIAEAVARGLTNAEVAAELGISVQTVKNMLRVMFDKLGINRRAEVVMWHLADDGVPPAVVPSQNSNISLARGRRDP